MGSIPQFDLQQEYGSVRNVKLATGFNGEFDGTGIELMKHLACSDNFDNLRCYLFRFNQALDKREEQNHFVIDCKAKKGIFDVVIDELPDFNKGRVSQAVYLLLQEQGNDGTDFMNDAMTYYQNVKPYQGEITKEQLGDESLNLKKEDIEEFKSVNDNYAKAQKNMAAIAVDQGDKEKAKEYLQTALEYVCSVGFKRRIQEQILQLEGTLQPTAVSTDAMSAVPDNSVRS